MVNLEQGLQEPLDRTNRPIAKGTQPGKVPLQAAEMAVIYSHLNLTTSKGDGKREAAGCWSDLSVTEIKGNVMHCHSPPSGHQYPPRRHASALQGGNRVRQKGHVKPLAPQPSPAQPLWAWRSEELRVPAS